VSPSENIILHLGLYCSLTLRCYRALDLQFSYSDVHVYQQPFYVRWGKGAEGAQPQ